MGSTDDHEAVRLDVETEDGKVIGMRYEYVSGVCHGLLTVLFNRFATRVIRDNNPLGGWWFWQ